MLAACDAARAQSELLSTVVAKAFNLEALANNPSLCAALAAQIRAAASAARLAAVDKERQRVRSLFENKGDRTSALVLQLLDEVIGSGDVQAGKVSGLWRGVLRRLEDLKARARDFAEVESFAAKLSAAGAPAWAKRVTGEKSGPRRGSRVALELARRLGPRGGRCLPFADRPETPPGEARDREGGGRKTSSEALRGAGQGANLLRTGPTPFALREGSVGGFRHALYENTQE